MAIARFLLLVMLGAVGGQGGERSGELEIVVTNAYGAALKEVRVSVARLENDRPTARYEMRSSGVLRVPYGEYLITGEAPLHFGFSRRVTLAEKHLPVFVAFSFRDSGHSSVVQTDLHGRVAGMSEKGRRYFVRAVGVWATVEREAVVGKDGRFVFTALPYGEYLLLVLQDSSVVAVERFTRTAQEETAAIELRHGRTDLK